ncbi:MAG: N-acetyltransferase [Proteobacteria bacterium]|nr:N-acetyltransferase [Pseudomonadota bacterium]
MFTNPPATFTITGESSGDRPAIDALLDQGFGPDRHSRTVYSLRQTAPISDLGFIVRAGLDIAASLRFWPVLIGADTPALLLGPLVVAPEHRKLGLGKRLVIHGLEQVTTAGWQLCLVVGDAAYYTPFGFEPARPWGLDLLGPVEDDRFQVRALAGLPLEALLPAGDRTLQPWRSVRGGAAEPDFANLSRAA